MEFEIQELKLLNEDNMSGTEENFKGGWYSILEKQQYLEQWFPNWCMCTGRWDAGCLR